MTVKEFFKFHWILESDRPKHVVIVFFVGLFFGIGAAWAASATAEFKDWLWNGKKGGILGWTCGNGFDWLDLLASMIGGIAGSVLRWYSFGMIVA